MLVVLPIQFGFTSNQPRLRCDITPINILAQLDGTYTHTDTHFSDHALHRQEPLLPSPREIHGPEAHVVPAAWEWQSCASEGKSGAQRQKKSSSDWRPVVELQPEPDKEGEPQRPNSAGTPRPRPDETKDKQTGKKHTDHTRQHPSTHDPLHTCTHHPLGKYFMMRFGCTGTFSRQHFADTPAMGSFPSWHCLATV